GLEEHPQSACDERVIVHEEHANGQLLLHRSDHRGISTWTAVSAERATRTVPPRAAARSVMERGEKGSGAPEPAWPLTMTRCSRPSRQARRTAAEEAPL